MDVEKTYRTAFVMDIGEEAQEIRLSKDKTGLFCSPDRKIGSQKPDRIYFCSSVPDKVKIDNVDLSGKIYVYKITEHA
ncbi:MAG: hypothetical protein K2N73_17430 [Lachnospiraceae bacterium]|nr:hypothetical protein [Lachnospiraceae bacterium]